MKNYIKPKFDMHICWIEDSISVASNNITPNQSSIKEQWESEETIEGNYNIFSESWTTE